MLRLGIREAQRRMDELIERVISGEEIEITRSGKRVAKMIRTGAQSTIRS